MDSLPFLCYLLIFIMAFMYSSVGHGGASGYLAVLAMLGVSQIVMKPSALLLNIFVSGISFFQYYRTNHFNFRLFWPFAFTSVPAAFIGALIPLTDSSYKKILGICLIFSVLRLTLFGWKDEVSTENQKLKIWIGLFA
ncbi:MAG: sulfite exporter TauE/SafE family protein, partial [Opitutaceae bacterium]|nr:sulfite exporter TauE/SafE family protein [Cytophagales bacterium]